MRRPALVLILLLLTASIIIEGSLDERVERTAERMLVIDYRDLHDTIPAECVRIMNSSRIEYWKGLTIIHISDPSYKVKTIEIVSWDFFSNEKLVIFDD